MAKTKILLLFGGESSEHEVSLASAKNVYDALDTDKYETELCHIDKTGKWWLVDDVSEKSDKSPMLVPALGTGQLATVPYIKTIKPDVLLPVLHGANGEDGTVQGLARLLHIPIAGPGLLGAAITMDKEVTKRLLKDAGIPVISWLLFYSDKQRPSFEQVSAELGSPLFVKPATTGSSVGVSKVDDPQSFKNAMFKAAKYDNKILIERAAQNARELEVAVLGNENPEATVPGEIEPGDDFYTYDEKYSPESKTKLHVPAKDLTSEQQEFIKDLAVKSYKAAACRGMARVDFFMLESGEVFVNEINSIPGFTNISMYPKLWQHEGLEYPKLLDKLIKLALEEN